MSLLSVSRIEESIIMIKLLLFFPFMWMTICCHPYNFDKTGDTVKCGYYSCPTPIPGKLNVHLVPHSHDDVGWLKTVDQYYYGSKSHIQNAGVQYILDSVVQELLHDPKKRFIYVETAFLWKWWQEQNDHVRHQVKSLVDNGRLEIVGGAWSMNDEATTHYQSIIDQFTWGFRRLNDTFGSCGRPKIGWQIDPFGHSRETASIMAQMGFDGLLFGRLDYQDKRQRLLSKTMEMIWEGSPSLGSEGDLFTGALYNYYMTPSGFCWDILCEDEPIIDDPKSADYNVDTKVQNFIDAVHSQSVRYLSKSIMMTFGDDFHYQNAHRNKSDLFTVALFNQYQAPLGFCFDIMCGDEPIVDDKDSPIYNVDERVSKFLKFVENQRQGYATDDIIVTMGGDFNYQDAHYYFKNLEKLIRYVNERQSRGSNVNVFYSTPSCYIKSLNEANIHWPTMKSDFFPYASDSHSYWTGYFTSRPTLKYFERLGNNFLQVCKQLASITNAGLNSAHFLNPLREAMGVMQHHDAVTGTEKQHVAEDYARILNAALEKCGILVNNSLNQLMKNEKNSRQLEWNSCHLSNISMCNISAKANNFIVTVYNPLSRPVSSYVRLPVLKGIYAVHDPRGMRITHQLVPIPLFLKNIPGRKSETDVEIVFKAESLPPLGYRSYFISKSNELFDDKAEAGEETMSDIEKMQSYFNVTDGKITFAINDSYYLELNVSAHYYLGEEGNNLTPDKRSSGAYIFRPKTREPIQMESNVKDNIYKGKVLKEVHQVFSDWASQIVRQYANESYLEIEWLVGPIPIDDGHGKETVWRYTTDIKSNGTFFTDSNGRQTIERRKNYRPTWDLKLYEPVAGNYYPVTTDISINDEIRELTVVVDRAQGGTSLNDGEIELMVHRRLLKDDAFGVGEALNETAFGQGLVARGHHYVATGEKEDPEWPKRKRHLIQQKVLNSFVVLTNADFLDFDTWSKSYNLEFSGLSAALPDSVQILTLEPWKGSSFLLRLEHLFEKNESQEDVTVNLNGLFTTFNIISIRETTLGANQWLDESSRLKWKKESNEVDNEETRNMRKAINGSNMMIKLRPKEIRTFICQIKPKMFLQN